MTVPSVFKISSLISGTSALSFAWPTHAAGDIGILALEYSGDSAAIAAPSGWEALPNTPVTDVASASGSTLRLWWRRATSASEPAIEIPAPGNHHVGYVLVIRGAIASGNPYGATASGTKDVASTSTVIPSITTTASGSLVLMFVTRPDDTTSAGFTSSANSTLEYVSEIVEGGSTSGNGGGLGIFLGVPSAVGAIGDTTLTLARSLTSAFYSIELLGNASVDASLAFPALAPVGRRYSAGVYPTTIEAGFGGGDTRFLHTGYKSGIELELQYQYLNQTEAKLIRDHYRRREGGHQSFLLPSTVWAGQSDVTNIAPTGTRWKYASVPEETQKSGGYVDITVSLISVR